MLISLRNYWDRDAVRRLLGECMCSGNEEVDAELDSYAEDHSQELFGGFVNGELAGVIGIRYFSGDEAVIRHLAVQAEWRGNGIGRGIIEELSRTEGIVKLKAETDRDAVDFYRNAGFHIVSLGEQSPGVERFECTLSVSDPRAFSR